MTTTEPCPWCGKIMKTANELTIVTYGGSKFRNVRNVYHICTACADELNCRLSGTKPVKETREG